jgi:hypothetical protein
MLGAIRNPTEPVLFHKKMTRWSKVLTFALAAAALLASEAAIADGHRAHRSCGPRASVTEAFGRLGRAYRAGGHSDLRACLYGHRSSRSLIDSDWFPRPAIQVSSTLVGFAAVIGEADEPGTTSIEIEDLAKPQGSARILEFGLGSYKIGSLRLKSDASVAWIQCPVLNNQVENGSPQPNCVSPGHSVNAVYKRDKATNLNSAQADLLDQGKGIDPRSLRLRGSTLSWIDNGARRTATLR